MSLSFGKSQKVSGVCENIGEDRRLLRRCKPILLCNFSQHQKSVGTGRSDSDYDDYYVISKEEVEHQIEAAQFFVKGIEQYIITIISA